MRNIRLNLLYAISFLSLTTLTIPNAEAANIPNGATVTAPPQTDEAMNFLAPAPGGTFIIQSGITFTGAITNAAAGVGTLVLNSASQLNGAVGTGVSPLLQITLNGNATIIGATSAQTFNLGQNTLTNQGALNLPSGIVLNTRVVSNALFGNISVTGADSIAGASVTVNVDASGVVALTPGAPLFVISAQGTTSGLPVNVTSNNVLYSFIGNNLNGNITITPTLNPVIPPVPGGGVSSALTALLAIAAANPGSDIATVVAALAALPTEAALADALLQLNPIVDGALPRVSFQAAQQFQNLWSKHMGYGRCVYATNCKDCCRCPQAECDTGQYSECCGCFSEINCANVCNRPELWVDAFGSFGDQEARDNFRGYNDQVYGGMLGFQLPMNRTTSWGLGAGYAHSHVHRTDLNGNKNFSNIQTYDATLYLSYDPTHWYLDTAFSFDLNRYSDTRHIQFPGINRVATAHYYGQQYTALAATGYRFYTRSCWIFTPLASLQYSYLHVNHHREKGAGDIDLQVEEQDYNFLESSLGLKISRIIQTRGGAFVPEVHAMWLHDYFGDAMDLDTTFSGVAEQAGPFRTKGPSFDRNLGDVGAGITFISCSRLALELVYNYEFGKTYHAHEGLVKVTQRF